jgi:DNA-binding NtrC family response regulator
VKELSSEAMRALLGHPWPGNVRELRTAIEHGVVMSNGPKITLRHLPASVTGGGAGAPGDPTAGAATPGDAPDRFDLAAAEQRLIDEALAETGGNRTEAAKLLGISRRTLQRKLKERADAAGAA